MKEAISCDGQRPSEVIRGHQRPSEVIRGHQQSSEVRGHPRSSEVIRGHPRSAAALVLDDAQLHLEQPLRARRPPEFDRE